MLKGGIIRPKVRNPFFPLQDIETRRRIIHLSEMEVSNVVRSAMKQEGSARCGSQGHVVFEGGTIFYFLNGNLRV